MTPVPSGDSGYTLRLCEDTLPVAGRGALGALNRVLYVRRGAAVLATAEREGRLAEGEAWHGAYGCEIPRRRRGRDGAAHELIRGLGAARPRRPGRRGASSSTRSISTACRLLDARRSGRFAPGGVALPHRHRGGGIRCLLAGALEVTVGDGAGATVTPGGAWFESGREPGARGRVDGRADELRPGRDPAREIRGRTSIMYVDPKDAERGGRARTRCSSTSRSRSLSADDDSG